MEQLRLMPNLPQRAVPVYAEAVRLLLCGDVAGAERLAESDTKRHRVGAAWIELEACVRVLLDLAHNGWRLAPGVACSIEVLATPPLPGREGDERRRQVRSQELRRRDEQLCRDSVRRFVARMETASPHRGAPVSVFGLMRDGRDLARSLEAAATTDAAPPVEPYVQVVEPGVRCAHTGRLLTDIWRYFRHTWANQYKSVPGRSMSFLVRDAAAPRHPVMGLFALSSAVVQIKLRDHFLGWHPDQVLSRLSEHREPALMEALVRLVDEGLDELHTDDLLLTGLLPPSAPRDPSPDIVMRLRELAEASRAQHNQSPDRSLKRPVARGDSGGWRRRAESSLYRSKRAKQVADLLEARIVLRQHLSSPATEDEVGQLLSSASGRAVARKLIRRRKARQVGIALADLTVCGAVAPYNHLLGGKLVAMLAASPLVVRQYSTRYADSPSEIASSLAGREVVRTPALVFIGTTSLYGTGLNQYTRVKYPCAPLGGEGWVRYKKLGRSEAYGTSQFSEATVSALALVAERDSRVRRVNNIFGEGQSPKLRLIREGLDALELPSDQLLRHHRARVVYGVSLATNTSDYLLGLAETPNYRFDPDKDDSCRAVSDHWWRRWVLPRLKQGLLVDRVREEVLVHPIRHGARVLLPEVAPTQLSIFDDLD